MLVLSGKLLGTEPRVNRESGEVTGNYLHILAGLEVFKVGAPNDVSLEGIATGDNVEAAVRINAWKSSRGEANFSLSAASVVKAGRKAAAAA